MYPREYFDTFWRGDIKNEVFVIMPFTEEFTPVWEYAIKPAIEEDTQENPIARRVDTTTITGNIAFEILEGIAHAKIVFADISVCTSEKWKGQRNGNVMYEVGLAHALRQKEEIIMVRKDDEEINFDIVQIRVQRYDPSDLHKTRKEFSTFIKNSINTIDNLKSLKVEQAVRSLTANCPRLMFYNEGFHIHEPTETKPKSTLTILRDYDGVRTLMSLGMLWCDLDLKTHQYAYHWTDFGKIVLQKAGFLKNPKEAKIN